MGSHHKTYEDLIIEQEQIHKAKLNPINFSVLYDKYYRSIFVFIYRRTGNENITADITSIVFLKAIVNIKKFEFKGLPFSAWLFRIALNELNEYYRRAKSERIISFEDTDIHLFAAEAELESNLEEMSVKLVNALSTLSHDQIQLVEMRFFEKRSFSEIGNILDITENNAKIKLYRILDRLKKILIKK